MALVALSVIEQRYRAVMAVLDGARVSEVAAEVGVSRESSPLSRRVGLAPLKRPAVDDEPLPHYVRSLTNDRSSRPAVEPTPARISMSAS